MDTHPGCSCVNIVCYVCIHVYIHHLCMYTSMYVCIHVVTKYKFKCAIIYIYYLYIYIYILNIILT